MTKHILNGENAMKKIAAIFMSVWLSAGLFGCSSSDSSSEFKPPSYLKKYQNDEQKSDDNEQSGGSENEETTAETTEEVSGPEDEDNTLQHDEGEETPEAEYAPASESDGFPYGIWWANDGSGDSYYFFAADNRTGSHIAQENGLEVDFSYEIYGNTAVFHMDGADSAEAMVHWLDSSELILNWSDGRAENLVYYSPMEASDFYFYSNSQLAGLGIDYFEMQNGWRPYYAEADVGAGGLIDVMIYDGGECCECYSVDRFTACGTDLAGNYVVLD